MQTGSSCSEARSLSNCARKSKLDWARQFAGGLFFWGHETRHALQYVANSAVRTTKASSLSSLIFSRYTRQYAEY